MRRTLTTALVILIAGQVASLSAQDKQHPDQQSYVFRIAEKASGLLRSEVTLPGGERQLRATGDDEPVAVIVEFREQPLSTVAVKQRSMTASAINHETRFRQFRENLLVLWTGHRASLSKASLPEIDREFLKAFFGVSLTVPLSMLGEISNLPYVKSVHPDREVTADLADTVPLIRADRVWQELGSRGEGVVVGIIDTGIDYQHPALGGGFGPGFKVIGGYDFENDDNDPMDDNRHGTHVAGIVAADSDGLTGVAPGVQLVAIKVLGAGGRGHDSTVLAGIEYATDPNGDGDFSDRLDVVNMSLGNESGDPDTPAAIAVDNGTRLGMVFCISAGNREDFRSIGSPGTARSAITVGASTKSDELATFSSKGPNERIFSIKPEVLAPGVSVISSTPGGNQGPLTGTSMSAPHVAGVAALLKALHPAWTPEQIKSALMTTAIDLGAEAMVQGAGRIDAFAAATITAFAEPAHLSFGLARDAELTWTKNDTFRISNISSVSQTFSSQINGLSSGITLSLSPSAFTLSPGSAQDVIASLNVARSVPYKPDQSSLSYGGEVLWFGTADTLRMPWAFTKTRKLQLVFDEAPADLHIFAHSFGSDFRFEFLPGPKLVHDIIAVPVGTYDIMALFRRNGAEAPAIVVKPLTLTQSTTIEISRADATLLVDLNGRDEDDVLLSERKVLEGGTYVSRILFNVALAGGRSGFVLNGSIDLFSDSLRFSPLDSNFKIGPAEVYHTLGAGNDAYAIGYQPLRGLQIPWVLQNDPSKLQTANVEMFLPPHGNPQIAFLFSFLFRNFEFGRILAGMEVGSQPVTNGLWKGQIHVAPDIDPENGVTVSLRGLQDTTRVARDRPWVFTEDFRIHQQKIGSFSTTTPSEAVFFATSDQTLRFGDAPLYPDIVFYNTTEEVSAQVAYRGSLDEERHGDVRFTHFAIYNSAGDRLRAGLLLGEESNCPGACIYREVTPGIYSVGFYNQGYYVGDKVGFAEQLSVFDTRRNDSHPPSFTSLKLFGSAGVPVGRIEVGEAGLLEFSAADFLEYNSAARLVDDSTKAWLKPGNTQNWTELPVSVKSSDYRPSSQSGHRPTGSLYTADLALLTNWPASAVDLRIRIRDRIGNSSELILRPAFAIGNFVTDVSPGDPQVLSPEIPREFALYQNYPNPFNPETTIRYDLPTSGHVSLRIFNLLGQEVRTLVDEGQPPGFKQVQWDGLDRSNREVASGIYVYRLKVDEFERSEKMLLLR